MQSNDHRDTVAGTGKPLVLIVLDGWGHRDSCEANALCYARLPVWERLWKTCPHTLVSGSGMDVGLPDGQMGNSEVGHMAIGAGRVIYQSLTRLNKAIEDGEFLTNPAYCAAIDKVVAAGKALHIFGLLSPGGVHSHEDHIIALINMAASRGAQHIYVHAFLDGRDTPPRSAEPSLVKTEQCLRDKGVGRIATVCGRYYAMDRDNRWERVRPVYEMLTEGRAEFCANDPVTALHNGYARDENDEFIKPTVVGRPDETPAVIHDGDAIIFMNFRPDRAREITRTFTEDAFSGFQRATRPALSSFVMTTEYAADIHADSAFYAESLANGLGEYLSAQGKTQLRIAETEKYAHVTFFFSGGREAEYAGEDRILVPSPNVATYDLKPEMSAFEVTDELVAAIHGRKYDVIICNFANGDMVGHTGNFEAAVKAVEAVDICLGRVTEALLKVGGECLITADHGNVELMLDPDTHQPHTAHTCEMVPLIYVGNRAISFTGSGTLVDVAPSMLALMGLSQPLEMTGQSLVAVPKI